MKRFILLWALLGCLSTTGIAQSGFTAGYYYSQRYQVSDVAIGYPYAKYNSYGQYIGQYQVYRRARWHRADGGHYVYFWSNYGWQKQWRSGYCYYFDWVNYERRVY